MLHELNQMIKMINKTLHTKWGNATLRKDGYYRISSKNEGNHNKSLHKLIWESVWGKTPKGWIIHHLDENPTNNCILNLFGMPIAQHISLHKKNKSCNIGESNPFYGKHHTEETKQKISSSHKGKIHSIDALLNMSNAKNTSGYFRVSKEKRDDVKQGFVWKYYYYDSGKRKHISSVDIKKLEEKVKSKNLEWRKL